MRQEIRNIFEIGGPEIDMHLWVEYNDKYHDGFLREYKKRLFIVNEKKRIPFDKCTDICINLVRGSSYYFS